VEAKALATGKKNARRLGAHLIFVDESGFLLIPTIRKTWSPRGQTPLLRHQTWPRHKISVISGISISPIRHRLGLYFALHQTNIARNQVLAFLRQILRHLRGAVILLWDNSQTHRGPLVADLLARHPRLQIERFPAYAPELNPDEGVWNHTKREMANGQSRSAAELEQRVLSAMLTLRSSQRNLRACVHRSGLKFF
jgi:transposase